METKKNTTAQSCNCGSSGGRNTAVRKASALNIVSAVVFFLFPKCPICWAAYGSFLSFIGFENLRYNPTWQWVVLGLFLLGSIYLLYKHYRNRAWWNIVIYTSGIGLLALTYWLDYDQTGWLIAITVLIILSNVQWRSVRSRLRRMAMDHSTLKA